MIYSESVIKLEEALFSLHPQAKELYRLINDIKAHEQGQFFNRLTPMFTEKSPVSDKILFVLKQTGKFSKVAVIEQGIKKYQSNFNKGLSTPLHQLKGTGKIVSLNPFKSNSTKQIWYGLPEWFDGHGEPKHEHLGEDIFFLY